MLQWSSSQCCHDAYRVVFPCILRLDVSGVNVAMYTRRVGFATEDHEQFVKVSLWWGDGAYSMYIQYLQYSTCSTYNRYSTWRVHRHFSMCSWCMQHTFPVFHFTSNIVVVLWYSSPVWEVGQWVIFPQNGWPLIHWVMSTASVYLNMHVDNVNAAVNLFGHSFTWYSRGS